MKTGGNMEQVILDVREQDEFETEHIPGSLWVPLSQFGHLAPGVLQSISCKKVVFMCRSGARAELARRQFDKLGFGGQLKAGVFDGGILEWRRQGKPLVTRRASSIPLMRQVQIAAGSLVLVSSLLGLYYDGRAVWAAVFIGGGLTSAGITGFCGLARLLSIMPWNRARPAAEAECSCDVKGGD
jgi:rhodanese-related sulfurtransferase